MRFVEAELTTETQRHREIQNQTEHGVKRLPPFVEGKINAASRLPDLRLQDFKLPLLGLYLILSSFAVLCASAPLW